MKAGRVKGVSDQFIFALQNSHYFVESRRFRGPIMHASLIGIDHTFCSQLSVFTLLTAVVNRASWAHKPWELGSSWVSIGGSEETCPSFFHVGEMPTPPVFYFIKNICRHIA